MCYIIKVWNVISVDQQYLWGLIECVWVLDQDKVTTEGSITNHTKRSLKGDAARHQGSKGKTRRANEA